MKKRIILSTIPWALALLPLSVPGEISQQKTQELYERFEQNIFTVERIRVPILMSGPCHQDKEGNTAPTYMITLLYPHKNEIFFYSRLSFFGRSSYQDFSADDAIKSFVKPTDAKPPGKMMEEGHIRWKYKSVAYSMVQENTTRFIIIFSAGLSAPLSYCELSLH